MAILEDGFATLISFAENATVKLEEKEVQPPSIEGGGENNVTTMRNTAWRTKAPKKLKTLGESSCTVAYDPAVYPEIVAMININQAITLTFPDGSTLVFWGWIDGFSPNTITEGEQPTAELTIVCSNRDGDNNNVEIAPAYAAAP